MENAAYEYMIQKGVVKPCLKRELNRIMNEDYW